MPDLSEPEALRIMFRMCTLGVVIAAAALALVGCDGQHPSKEEVRVNALAVGLATQIKGVGIDSEKARKSRQVLEGELDNLYADTVSLERLVRAARAGESTDWCGRDLDEIRARPDYEALSLVPQIQHGTMADYSLAVDSLNAELSALETTERALATASRRAGGYRGQAPSPSRIVLARAAVVQAETALKDARRQLRNLKQRLDRSAISVRAICGS